MRRSCILRISTSKTIVRLTALGLLLLSSLGPWFTDAHPATVETCTAPLVWLGEDIAHASYLSLRITRL